MSNVDVYVSNGVMQVVFNRPERKNALTSRMYIEASRAITQSSKESEVRVIVVSGRGGTFTVGNDLDDFVASPPDSLDAPAFTFLTSLAECATPIVAVVEGFAIGIGTTMLMHCDLVYASDNTRFALPFATLGLVPEGASSLLLPQLCGLQRASEKLMLGDQFGAKEAYELGIVSAVVDHVSLHSHANSKVEQLTRLPPGALRSIKELMRAPNRESVRNQIAQEQQRFAARLKSASFREAVAAFKSKRRPDFTGLD